MKVDVWSGATDGVVGRVTPDWENHDFTQENMTTALVSVLCGAMSDGEPQVDICAWPICPELWRTDGNVSDGRKAKFLADWLGLDQVGWGRVVYQANRLAKEDRLCRRLWVATAQELYRVGELFQPELNEIAKSVTDD